MPRLHVGKAFELLVGRAHDQAINAIIPGYEREIGVSHFIAYKPLFASESAVENPQDALQLVVVAGDGRWELLGVENIEPARLAEVRTLTAYLESEPLVAEMLLLQSVIAEHVLGVILLDDVLDDRASLPESNAGIRVFNSYSR